MVEEEGLFETPVGNPNASLQETPPPSPGPSWRKSKATIDPENTQTTTQSDLDLDDDEEEELLETILVPLGKFAIRKGTGDTSASSNSEGEGSPVLNKPAQNDETAGTEWDEEGRKKEPEILCPTHSLACAKKICLDYQKLLRARERKKMEEREKNKKKKKPRGNWRGMEVV